MTGVYVTGIAQDISVKQMTKSGQINYTGQASKVTRYSDGKARIYQLKSTLFNTNHTPPWQATANNAWSYPGNSKVNLWGDVNIWRASGPSTSPIHYQSAQLTLFPHRNYAETSDSVRIFEPGTQNVTTAIGMRAWSDLEKVELLSKVKSIYDAPQKVVSQPAAVHQSSDTTNISSSTK